MLVQFANGTFIPNHRTMFNSITGGLTDLVITDVTLEDDNTVYTCSATGASIASSVVLNVAVNNCTYVCMYVYVNMLMHVRSKVN